MYILFTTDEAHSFLSPLDTTKIVSLLEEFLPWLGNTQLPHVFPSLTMATDDTFFTSQAF